MSDEKKEKIPLGRRLHAIGAGLMIIGSPFAAFVSFGAAVMFLFVGLLWLGLVGLVAHGEEKKKAEAKEKSSLKIVA